MTTAPSPPDWRGLCEELVLSWDADGCDWKPQHQARWNATLDRARAALARWGNYPAKPDSSAPTPVGEVADVVEWLRYHAKRQEPPHGIPSAHAYCTRAADLLERQAAPAPVSVSERLPGAEDCDEKGRCWWWYPEVPETTYAHWQLEDDATDRAHDESPSAWLPAHALPLPSGEVEHD